MFAGLRRRRGLPPGHRSPRRVIGWAVLVLAVAIVIGEVTADVVGSSRSATSMQARTFAVAVGPIIDESTALVSWITDVRREALGLGRVGIDAALGRLVAGADDAVVQYESLGVAPPSAESGRLLASVLTLRLRAAKAFTGAVSMAIGPSPSASAVAVRLGAVGRAFALSDGRYRRFLASLPAPARRAGNLGPSSWAGSADWSKPAVLAYAELLAHATGLHESRAVSIVAVALEPPALRISGLPTTTTTTTTTSTTTTTTSTTLPGSPSTSSTLPPTTTTTPTTTTPTTTTTTTTTTTLQVPPPGSTSWLPATSSISVVVVVANAGASIARDVSVTATASPLPPPPAGKGHHGGPAARIAASFSHRLIGELLAGASIELVMPALGVRPGTGYVLTVRLGDQVDTIKLEVAPG